MQRKSFVCIEKSSKVNMPLRPILRQDAGTERIHQAAAAQALPAALKLIAIRRR